MPSMNEWAKPQLQIAWGGNAIIHKCQMQMPLHFTIELNSKIYSRIFVKFHISKMQRRVQERGQSSHEQMLKSNTWRFI